MDLYSSGEGLLIKTRKPYTITKQRERWTEEEHNRFLEALKLYGRSWQRIEEHIGTKTAVQIRSHAQKFFTKLEKEALVKGVPVRQAIDIEIPLPRPKRKPCNPYPRKTGLGTPPSQVAAKDGKQVTTISSLHSGTHTLDLEKEPLLEKPDDEKELENAKKDQDEENCTENFPLFQEAPCASLSSANDNSSLKPAVPKNPCTFREYVPILEEVINQGEPNESYITVEPKGNRKLDKHETNQTFQDNSICNSSNFGISHPFHEDLVQGQNTDKLGQPENFGSLSINDMQGAQNYPRHVPVHIVDGSHGMSAENVFPNESTLHQMGKVHGHPNLFANLSTSTTITHHSNASRSSISQTFPTFHPLFTPGRDNPDDNRSCLHMPSTFSSLTVSSLLQNPAAHAAASFAATFWPSANLEASSGDSSAGGSPSGQLNSSAPSMATIAAATVAAATAWWAGHGLLPFCAPFHTGFSCSPLAFATSINSNQAGVSNNGREYTPPEGVLQEKTLEVEQSKALVEQHSGSKSPTLSSSKDSKESGKRKVNTELTAADTEQAAVVDELHDLSKTKIRKQVDRSSCGSNTTSSSDTETDALEKNEKAKEEIKDPDANHQSSDSTNRRSRSFISPNDSWKEVSEEGRLAFQALFSREVLPQSFSPPNDLNAKSHQNNNIERGQQNAIHKLEVASQLGLNSKLWVTCSCQQAEENSAFTFCKGEKHGGEGLLTLGLEHRKLKARRTGFKPYKRCSVEAKESKMISTGSHNDEKGPKRMRLEGEASI